MKSELGVKAVELKKIKIRNFLGIGRGEIAFDKTGVVLIEGINHDSPSSVSNGAGKSSIFEALFWVLFGKTKRGLAGDDVINNVAKKNCRVELEFDEYRVVRTRRDDEHGTALLLSQRSPEGTWKDLTLGTVRDTQKLLEDTMKMSDLAFSKVAYFGQSDIRGFAGLTDSDLKRVFEQALGLAFFSEYHERVKEHRLRLDAELREMGAVRSRALRDSEHAAEKMELLRRSLDEYEARVAGERTRIEVELEETVQSTASLEAESAAFVRELESRLAELGVLELDMARIEKDHAQAIGEWRELDRQLTRLQVENTTLVDRIMALEAELEVMDDRVGAPCETCGKPYEEKDIEVARENLLARRNRETSAYQAGMALELEADAKLASAVELCEKLKRELAAFDHVKPAIAALRVQLDEWSRNHAERIAILTARRKELEKRLEELAKGEPKELELYEAAKREKIRLDAMTMELGEQTAKAADEIETAKMLEEILGNGGMKSYVFDAITPQLNKLIDRNIKILDDIDIEVSTVTRLKSGEFRERFSIEVNNHHGARIFEGNSGGEMQKINLAISLAINSLMRTIAEGSINAIFLDECFENLDEGSSERVFELIATIDIPNVFLITQRSDVKELIPTVIRVEKRGGAADIH